MNAGDQERFLTLWTADLVKMTPNAPQVIGIENMSQRIAKNWGLYDSKMAINTQEAVVRGDMAFARGLYANEQPPGAVHC